MAGVMVVSSGCRGEKMKSSASTGSVGEEEIERQRQHQQQQRDLSLLAAVLAAIRRSVVLVGCRIERSRCGSEGDELGQTAAELHNMEIGWPTDVQHVAHVTFDRFNGFLGLPVEFELEIPCRVPSASASVFGVSAESMQCCYDPKGNSVPTILLLMQERLYQQDGLKAEGIFRINPENGQEEHVRDQLNKGVVPDDIDVHCLAGLIKAWFRELPEGVLDSLSPEQVLNCNTEEEFVELVQQLLPTQHALLNWAVELMADVVEEEEVNKMNARNIAMVFAPNMTQMSDPLTALMHAVQVMNLLKSLILKTLREREEAAMDDYSSFSSSPISDRRDSDANSQRDVDMSGELRHSTSDASEAIQSEDDLNSNAGLQHVSVTYYVNHCNSSEDESEQEIEECFLMGLDQKKDNRNDKVGFPSPIMLMNVEDERSSFSGSVSKHESSITTDAVDWDASATRDLVVNAKSLSDRAEGGKGGLLFKYKWTP